MSYLERPGETRRLLSLIEGDGVSQPRLPVWRKRLSAPPKGG